MWRDFQAIIIEFKNLIQFLNFSTIVVIETTIIFWKWISTLFFWKENVSLVRSYTLPAEKSHWHAALSQHGNLPRSRGSVLLIDLPVWNLFLATMTSYGVENTVHLSSDSIFSLKQYGVQNKTYTRGKNTNFFEFLMKEKIINSCWIQNIGFKIPSHVSELLLPREFY